MPEGQRLLRKQSIQGNRLLSKEIYRPVLGLEPNRRILGTTPYLAAYFAGLRRHDTAAVQARMVALTARFEAKKNQLKDSSRIRKLENTYLRRFDKLQLEKNEGNGLMRVIGEPPVYFTSAQAVQDSLQLLAKCAQKGLFEAKVQLKIDSSRRKKADVRYVIQEGTPTKVREVRFVSSQYSLDSLLAASGHLWQLQRGVIYDEEKVVSDRDAIERLLKNHGYFRFRRQYIRVELDTFNTGPYEVDLYFRIEKPEKDTLHHTYAIQKVYFITDYTSERARLKREGYVLGGVTYLSEREKYSRRLLSSKVRMSSPSMYALEDQLTTQRNLNNLDAFRIVNIFFKDTSSHGLIGYIQTAPLLRYERSEDVGIGVSQGLPGPFGALGFKARNVLGGFEVLEVNARASVEGQAAFTSDQQSYANYSTELSSTISLTIPQLAFPGKYRFGFNRLNPKTRLLLSYNYNFRPEYERSNLKAALVYSVKPGINSIVNVSLLDLTLVNTTKTAEFERFLQDLRRRGNPLIFSFNQSFISSIKLDYVFSNHNPAEFKKGFFFRAFFESGGTLLNLLSNERLASDRLFGLEYFRFYKFSADVRNYLPVTRSALLASRLSGGYATPYGSPRINSDGITEPRVLPYEKFFFTGGSASNRAWRPRRLGPGAFTPERASDGTFIYNLEQPGEILLEGNSELRVKVFRLFAIALFLDASNVWTIRKDETRPGSQFYPGQFLNQVALGSGIGFRLDFSFLLLRVDVGTMIKDPAQETSRQWMFDRFSLARPFGQRGQTNVNIGIGYPF